MFPISAMSKRRRFSRKQKVEEDAAPLPAAPPPMPEVRLSLRWRLDTLCGPAAPVEEPPQVGPAALVEEPPQVELIHDDDSQEQQLLDDAPRFVFVDTDEEELDEEDPSLPLPPAPPVDPVERAKRYGLSTPEYDMLRHFGVPLVLWQVLGMIFDTMGPVTRDLDCLDFFAGLQAVTKAWLQRGWRAQPFEIKLGGVAHDLCSGPGFITALIFVLRLKTNGFSSWGTVCSSWIWVCRSTSQRSKENPLGDVTKEFVRIGNQMVARMALLLLVLEARGCCWILEQPASSLMAFHPYLSWLFDNHANVFECRTSMGGFGAPTRKPTVLRSNRWWVSRLHRRAPALPESTTTIKSVCPITGRLQVTGNKNELKVTQVYPPAYGTALCTEWEMWQPAIPERLIVNPPPQATTNDSWTLIGIDNINTFMAGAGFAMDAHLAREAGEDTPIGHAASSVNAFLSGTLIGREDTLVVHAASSVPGSHTYIYVCVSK